MLIAHWSKQYYHFLDVFLHFLWKKVFFLTLIAGGVTVFFRDTLNMQYCYWCKTSVKWNYFYIVVTCSRNLTLISLFNMLDNASIMPLLCWMNFHVEHDMMMLKNSLFFMFMWKFIFYTLELQVVFLLFYSEIKIGLHKFQGTKAANNLT